MWPAGLSDAKIINIEKAYNITNIINIKTI
jgi:hypothetical protein